MKAKEYLERHKKVLSHFDDLNHILDDLYWIRHDRVLTKKYYDQFLSTTVLSAEYAAWQELHKEYGALCLEPEHFTEIGEQLLQAVKDDVSFGYIKNLLSPQDEQPSQQQIEQAIIEDLTSSLKTAHESISDLESQPTCVVPAEKEESSDQSGRTMKVTTIVLLEILKKLDITRVSSNATTISELISYLSGYSHHRVRQWLSSSYLEVLSAKAHKKEVDRINQLLRDLNLDITIEYK